MEANWRAQFARVGAFNARLEENIGGIRAVKAFANEDHERRLFAADNRAYKAAKLEAYKIMAGALTMNYLGMRFAQVVVMLAGTYYVVRGGLSIGGFVGFLLLLGVFYRPLDKINAVIESYPKGIAGFRRYRELLATEPDIGDAPDAVAAPPLKGDIRFENVTFGYAPSRSIIKTFDLTIRAGETVAFVGPSGAGKTTICSLLPRFYDVDAGRITIDGPRHPRDDAGFAAPPGRDRPAGRLPVRRDDPREHRLWRSRRRPRGDRGSGAPRATRRYAREPARWARHPGRRTRRQALRRAEAAPVDRPYLPQGSADPHLG